MAETIMKKQKVHDIVEKLERGLKDLFESENYKIYLKTMSKFHNYSFNNTLLIAMQMPEATFVAGFNRWQKNFDRKVKKGERAIRIIAPTVYKVKSRRQKYDPESGQPILDEDGNPVMEEVDVKMEDYKVVSVFDISQTEGKKLPELGVYELSDSVADYQNFIKALEMVSPVTIGHADIGGIAKGYFHPASQEIIIHEGMSQSQTMKTIIHEIAHAKLHDKSDRKNVDPSDNKTRNTKEVEAESIAYTVCQHFGIDTSEYSFGYIAGWSSDKEMKELKSSMYVIRRTASDLITGIEESLEYLKMESKEMEQNDQQAFAIGDHFISIQVCEDGYDYSIFDNNYRLLDGGIIEDSTMSMRDVLCDVVMDMKGLKQEQMEGVLDEIRSVDYDALMEKVEATEQKMIADRDSHVSNIINEDAGNKYSLRERLADKGSSITFWRRGMNKIVEKERSSMRGER